MAVSSVSPITDHADVAISRLPQKYKDPAKTWTWDGDDASAWDVVLQSFVKPAQDMETVLNDMLTKRSLDTAEGINLDRIGQIVGQDRGGETDARYRELIVGQIAENNSDGTAKELLGITEIILGDLLTGPLGVQEFFPAKVRVEYGMDEGETGIDPELVQDSMEKAKAAGVGALTLRYVTGDYFGFDSDPNAGGYGTLAPPGEETYASGNNEAEIFTATRQYCQSFEAIGSELISVSMNSFFNRFGTATGNIKLSLFTADGSDLPDTLIGDSTNTIDATTLDTYFDSNPRDNPAVTFNFASLAMTPGTTYCLVVSVVGYGGANLAFCFRDDNPYANGFAGSSSDSGVTWNSNISGITTADIQMYMVQSSALELYYGTHYSSLVGGN